MICTLNTNTSIHTAILEKIIHFEELVVINGDFREKNVESGVHIGGFRKVITFRSGEAPSGDLEK